MPYLHPYIQPLTPVFHWRVWMLHCMRKYANWLNSPLNRLLNIEEYIRSGVNLNEERLMFCQMRGLNTFEHCGVGNNMQQREKNLRKSQLCSKKLNLNCMNLNSDHCSVCCINLSILSYFSRWQSLVAHHPSLSPSSLVNSSSVVHSFTWKSHLKARTHADEKWLFWHFGPGLNILSFQLRKNMLPLLLGEKSLLNSW